MAFHSTTLNRSVSGDRIPWTLSGNTRVQGRNHLKGLQAPTFYVHFLCTDFGKGDFMRKINVTDFRQHLPGYLKQVQQGETIQITLHGKVVARLVSEQDAVEEAKKSLSGWRSSAYIGDLLSPTGEAWEAQRDRV